MQKDLKDPGSTRFGTVADAMDHKGDIVGIWCGYYITITIYILVVGLEHEFYFSIYIGNNHPN